MASTAGKPPGIFQISAPVSDQGIHRRFCCKERKLVIELDGGQHGEPKGVAADSRRTRDLEAWGYRVIRFWDNDVLQNMDDVVQAILEAPGEGV